MSKNSKRLAGVAERSFFQRSQPWFIWALGASFFFAEYFARVAPSIMAPDLMRSLQIGAAGLGTMSAFFLYPYVAMQVPVGALVDRFGPRRLIATAATLCGAGCFVFAYAGILSMAELGRFMMGITAAFAFVGALKLATIWFPPSRLGLLAGFTQGLGMLGAAVGEGPFATVVAHVGWRHTMVIMGSIILVIGILIGIFARDRVKKQNPDEVQQTSGSLLVGLRQVLANRHSWVNGLYVGLMYAPTTAFAELWGVSFLVRTYHLSTQLAASGISLIFLGWAVGGPIIGWFSDHVGKRRPLMVASAIVSLLTLTCALYINHLPIFVLFALLFLYGVANTGVGVSYAVSGEINEHRFAGVSIAFANMASVLIGALLQPIIGWLIARNWQGQSVGGIPYYSAHNYRLAMLVLPCCLLGACISVFWLKESYGSQNK